MKFNSRAPMGKRGGARTKKFFAGGGIGDDEGLAPAEEGAQTSPVPDQPKIEERPLTPTKRKSFKEAFAEARANNPGKNFTWTDAKGKTGTYTTDLAKPGAAKPASKPATPKPAAPKPASKPATADDIPGNQPVAKASSSKEDEPMISKDTERQLGNAMAALPVGRMLGAARNAGRAIVGAKAIAGARKASEREALPGPKGNTPLLEGPPKQIGYNRPERPKGGSDAPKDAGSTGSVGRGGKPTMGKRGQEDDGIEYKRGGKVKAYAKGGFVRAADGIAKRGHTKGRKC